MNRLQYRIVFNKQRGQLMAVAETTRSQSKSSAQSPAGRRRSARRSPGMVARLMLAGTLGLGSMGWVQAQIKADANAPKNQQPTVLGTANGVPQVNIQTPSAAGVSRNSYSQFDVKAQGAILNNARSDAATQLGGWVQGNPWLAKGSARVILNEVNSSQPSQLKGFVEIAGPRAELIIANPAGIQVNGGGFINASSATLTTGLPRWLADGQIAGYAVQGGLISISGQGLDASQTDYTALLARAVEVNAGLWAQDLRIGTGTQVMTPTLAPGEKLAPSSEARPLYALDSTALGGIYAQRITLVGTEAGLGVRQAGTLLAGQMQLSADGWLHNSGTIYAQEGQGTSLQVKMSQGVGNSGWLAARGSAGIEAAQIEAGKGSVIAAGLNEDGSLTGAASGAALSIKAGQALQLNGQALASQSLDISAPMADVSGAQLQANQISISGTDIRADAALLMAADHLRLKADRLLSTRGSLLSASSLALSAHDIDNRQGEWLHLGGDALTVDIGGKLALDGGRIAGNGSEFSLRAGNISAAQARLEQYGNGAMDLRAAAVNLSGAQVLANGALQAQADQLRLDGAELQARSAVLQASELLSHRQARLSTSGEAQLSADRLDNRGGRIEADAGLQIRAGTALDNDGGWLQAALGSVDIQGRAALSNRGGSIAARDAVSVQGLQLSQSQGGEIAAQDVRLQLQGALQLDSDGQPGTASRIVATRDLSLAAGGVFSRGVLQSAGALDLSAQARADLGGAIYAGGSLQARAGGELLLDGLLAAQGDVRVQAGGRLQGSQTSTLAAGMNAAGQIGSQGLLQVQAGADLRLQGQELAAEIQLRGERIDLSTGQVHASQRLLLQASQDLVSEGAQLSTGQLQLQAGNWQHAGGRLAVSGNDDVTVTLAGTLDNRQGRIETNSGRLSLQSQRLDNAGGLISGSGSALQLLTQQLGNQGGVISSAGAVQVQAQNLDNGDGQLSGQTVALTAGILNNAAQGLIAAQGPLSVEAGQLSNAGTLQAQGDARITSRGALSNSGLIYAQGLAVIQADGLSHSGTVAAQGALTVNAGSMASTGTFAAGLSPDNTLGARGDLALNAAHTLQHSGAALAAGQLRMAGHSLQLQGSQMQAQQLQLDARGGELRLDRVVLASAGQLKLNSADLLNTEGAQLSAADMVITAQDWRHAGGQLSQTDAAGTLQAVVAGRLDNQGGQIAANGTSMSLAAGVIANSQGRIAHAGLGELKIEATQLDGAGGAILGNGSLTMQLSQGADLRQAQTQAQSLVLRADSLNHQGGRMLSLGAAQLDIDGALDNTAGLIKSSGDLQLQAQTLDNRDGQIAGRDVRLDTGVLGNAGKGLIAAQGSLSLEAATLANAGGLQAGGDASIRAAVALDNSGLIHAQGQAMLQAGQVINTGTLAAQGSLTLHADRMGSSGTLAAGLNADGSLGAQGDLTLNLAQTLQHSGTMLTAGQLNATAAQLQLQDSQIQGRQVVLTAQAGDLRLDRAKLASTGTLNLSSAATLSSAAAQLSAADVGIGARDWIHAGGQLTQTDAAGRLQAVVSQQLDNRGGQIAANGQTLSLTAQDIANSQGRILHAGTGELALKTVTLGGVQGQILSAAALTLNASAAVDLTQARTQGQSIGLVAGSLKHQAGQLLSLGAASLTVDGAFDNTAGLLQSAADLQLQAAALDNRNGQINGQVIGVNAGTVSNAAQGLIAAQGALTLVADQLSNAGSLQAGGDAHLTVTGDVSNSGLIYAQGQGQLQLSGTLSHTGTLAAQGALTVAAGSIASSGSFAAGLKPDNTQGSPAALNLSAAQVLQHSGTTLATGRLTLSGASLQLQDSQTQGQQVHMTALTGDLQLDRAELFSTAGLTLQTAGTLSTEGATLDAADVAITAQNWRHAGGQLTQTDAAGQLSAMIVGQLDNRGGQIAANGQGLELSAQAIDNSQGRIVHAGVGALNINTNTLSGQQGKILSAGALSLNADGAVDLSQAITQAQRVVLTAGSLNHRQGQLLSLGDASLVVAADLSNGDGLMQAAGAMRLQAAALDNRDGQIDGQTVLLKAGSMSNTGQGLVSADGALTVEAGQLINAGGLQALGDVSLTIAGDVNNSGLIYSQGAGRVEVGGTLSHTGSLAAQGALNVRADSLVSSGSFAAGLRPDNSLAGAANLALQATQTLQHSGSLLAAGALNVAAASLQLQDSKTQARQVTMLAQAGELRLDRAALSSTGSLTLDGATLLNTVGAQLSAATVDIRAQDWRHAGGHLTQTDAAGSLQAQVSRSLDNQGGDIAANGQQLLLRAQTLINTDGRIAHAGTGELKIETATLDGARGQMLTAAALTLSASAAMDLSHAKTQGRTVALSAGSLDHRGGQLLGSAGVDLNVQGQLDNRAGSLQSAAVLTLRASSLDNSDGQLGGQSVSLKSAALSNGGQGLIWSQGGLGLESGQLSNAGVIQAQGDAQIQVAGLLSNSGRIYSQGRSDVKAGQLVHTGLLAAQGALSVAAGSMASSGGFAAGLKADNTLAAQGDLSLSAGQTLKHSGSLLAAGQLSASAAQLQLQDSQIQAARVTLAANAGELRLDRARLASAGGLSLASAGSLSTQAAELSAANVTISAAQDWHHSAGSLTQLDAAGTLQASVGDQLDNRGGKILASGQALTLSAQALINNTEGHISQAGSGVLKIQAGSLEGARGQLLTRGALMLEAGGAVNLDHALTQAQGLTLSAASLNHQGGEMLSGAGASMQVAGQVDNRGGTVASTGPLDLRAASLLNGAGGLLQSAAHLSAQFTGTLDNQGGRIRSGGNTLLGAASVDNRQGWVGSDGALTLQTQGDLLNGAGSLLAEQGLALDVGSLNNQQGRIASLQAGLTLRSQGGVDNRHGAMLAARALDLAANGLNNQLGEISGAQLVLDTRGQALDNRGGRLLATQSITVSSGALDNHGGLLQSLGDLSVQTHGAALLNTRDAAIGTPTGIQAQTALNLSAGELVNSAGISAGGTAQVRAVQLTNRAQLSGAALQLDIAGTLDNQGGQLLGTQTLNLSAQQLLNQGGLVYGGQSLDLRVAGLIDNRNTAGSTALGIQGGTLSLQAAQLDNRAGQVLANGNLQLNIGQSLDNAGGQLSALGRQLIGDGSAGPTASALAVNNAAGRIWSGEGLSLSARELSGGIAGQISSGGDLSLSLAGDFVYGGAGSVIQAQGNTTLNLSGSFTNQGTLRSGGALAINAAHIDNQAGAELSALQTELRAAGTLSNRGLIDGDRVTLTADRVLNLGSGRIYGDDIVITGGQLLNDREGGQAAVIAARRSLDAQLSRDITNRDGALVFADGDLRLAGTSLLNENATIEASRFLQLDLSGGLVNRSVHAGAGSGQDAGAASGVRVLDSKAFISSGGDMQITAGNVLNSGATIEARGNLLLKAGDIQNVNPYLMWTVGGDPLGDKVRFTGLHNVVGPNGDIEIRGFDEWVYLNGRTVMKAWGDYTTANPTYHVLLAPQVESDGTIIFHSWVKGVTPEGQPVPELVEERVPLNGRTAAQTWEDYQAAHPDYSIWNVPTVQKGGSTEVSQSSAARIIVGGQLQIQGARITNDMSIVEGRDGVAITGESVHNLNRTVSVTDPVTGVTRQVALTLPGTAQGYVPQSASPGDRSQAGTVAGGSAAQAQQAQGAGTQSAGGSGLIGQLVSKVLKNTQAGTAAGVATQASTGWQGAGAGNAQAVAPVDGLPIDGVTAQAGVRQTQSAQQQAVEQAQEGVSGVAAQASLRTAAQTQAQLLDASQVQHQALSAETDRRQVQAGSVASLQGAGAAKVNANAQAQARTAAQAQTVQGSVAGSIAQAPGAASTAALAGAATGRLSGKLAQAVAPNLGVPSNSLFKQHAEPSSRYLVETDPRFANYRDWLSSDYLLQAIQVDPTTTQKRLGDGYYEQKLVREQIGQLTGTQFLEGYSSDEAMYRAMLDNAASFAKAHQLRPGVALSAEQMSQLTSDLVWLVEQEVTLADGSTQRVLVPQVYLLPREGDLQPSGALIAGGRVEMALSGDFSNQGTVRGTQVDIEAQNIANSGSLRGTSLALSAREDLRNIGGELAATGDLSLSAGRDIVMQTTTASGGTQRGNVTTQQTVLDRVASLSAGGVMVMQAGRDVALQAVQITQGGAGGKDAGAEGGVLIQAGRDLTLSTVQTASASEQIWNANNYKKESRTQDVGSEILAEGAIVLKAGQDLKATAATISSEAGGITLAAGRDVQLLAGEANQVIEQMSQKKKSGFLKKKVTTSYSKTDETTAVGTTVSGETVQILAGQDIGLVGASVVSDLGTALQAGRNISIEGATNELESEKFNQTKKSGLMSGGGLGFSIGKQSLAQTTTTTTLSNAASTVASVGGDVTIVAGGAYKQVGSDISAPGGDVAIQAQKIDILESRNQQAQETQTKFKQSGLTVSLSAPGVSAAMGAVSAAEHATQTEDPRMKALAAATALSKAMQVQEEIKKFNDLTQAQKDQSIRVSISVGSSKSSSQQHSSADQAAGSNILAGEKLSLIATGGVDSNVTVRGSVLTGQDVLIKADNAIKLLAAQNTSEQHGKDKSSSASLGVGISLGADVNAGFSVSASVSKGNADGADLSYTTTQVQGGSSVTLQSGGDTALIGAVVTAPKVVADVGGNLKIESLQDTAKFDSKSQSAGGSATFGYAPGASVNLSQSKVNADYAAVGEQAGIRAGDQGFQVSVKGDTELIGGAITSAQAAINAAKNRFSTGTLTSSDIDNRSQFKASAVTVSAGTSGGMAGAFKDSGDDRSTTKSTISAGSTTITSGDATGQQTLDKLDRGATSDATASKLAQGWDGQKLAQQSKLNAQIVAEFGAQASKEIGDYAERKLQQADQLDKEAQREQDPDKRAALTQQAQQLKSDWGDKGALRVAAHAAIGGLTGNLAGAAGAAAGTLVAPAVADALSKAGIDPTLAKGLTALTSTVAGAALGGTAGGVAALNEVENNYLNHNRPSMLRLSEKERYEIASGACAQGDKLACQTRDDLALLSRERDQQLAQACSGATPNACNTLAKQASDMGNLVVGGHGGFVYANSSESGPIKQLSTVTIGGDSNRPANFHDKLARSTAEALLLESGNQFVGALVSVAAKGVGATTVAVREFFASQGVLVGEATLARIASNFGRDGDQFTTYADQMVRAQNAGWVTAQGRTWWPPGSGAVPGSEFSTTLQVGQRLDRFGGTSPTSTFLAPAGTLIEQRALSPTTNIAIRDEYVVLKQISVEQSNVMPWFGQPGMGVQFDTGKGIGLSIQKLEEMGFIKKVTSP